MEATARSVMDLVWHNHVTALRSALAHGADPNERDKRQRTPLMYAVSENKLEIAQLLIEAGARLDVQDAKGNPPLHVAARESRLELAALLLNAGATVDIENEVGNTALAEAVFHSRRPELARLLLCAGADGKRRNQRGLPALENMDPSREFRVPPRTSQFTSGVRLPTIAELLQLEETELARLPIWLVNWACAGGLPGLEYATPSQLERYRRIIAELAGMVFAKTEQVLPSFYSDPARFDNSEPLFRAMWLAQVLQRSGYTYRTESVALTDDEFFANPELVFIHGLFEGKGGSCASMPVLYAAVGRELGYPIKLVLAKGHVFARWDDPHGARFNIEATTPKGLNTFNDDHYRHGGHGKGIADYARAQGIYRADAEHLQSARYQCSQDEVEEFGYFRSLDAREELGAFLQLRGDCFCALGRYEESIAAYCQAAEAEPDPYRPRHFVGLHDVMNRWRMVLAAQSSARFPRLTVERTRNWLPNIPEDYENWIVHYLTMETLLNSPKVVCDWWDPAQGKYGPAPNRPVQHILAIYAPGKCELSRVEYSWKRRRFIKELNQQPLTPNAMAYT